MIKKPFSITICMGSSCFARGNNTNAEYIQQFIDTHGLGESIEIRGCLCEGECKKGPNIRINEVLYTGVTPEALQTILEHTVLGQEKV